MQSLYKYRTLFNLFDFGFHDTLQIILTFSKDMLSLPVNQSPAQTNRRGLISFICGIFLCNINIQYASAFSAPFRDTLRTQNPKRNEGLRVHFNCGQKMMFSGTPVNQNRYVSERSGINTIHVQAAFPNVFSR